MENNLMVFNNVELGMEVRWVSVDGVPYAVASDVAKALGYKKPNDAINTHCRCTVKYGIPHPQSESKELEVNIINEGDIYRLIFNSKLESAQKFESWVVDEVLPQIRKTGGYIPVKEEESESDILAKAFIIAQKTIEQKDKLLKQKQIKIEKYKDLVFDLTSEIPPMTLRNAINKIVRNSGMGYSQGWNKLYNEIYYRYRINLYSRCKNYNDENDTELNILEFCEEKQHLEMVYRMAVELFLDIIIEDNKIEENEIEMIEE